MPHPAVPSSEAVTGGVAIQPDFTHRLAAILAADAVGYSRLMAADERATLRALDAARAIFREHIEAHRGRVIDMAGDSVLAVFETIAGATAAAVEVQEKLSATSSDGPRARRLLFRIGLHLGDVIEKSDGTVYGDGVNIAARLQSFAKPGGICVGKAVRDAVQGKLDGALFRPLGARAVKNIAHPIEVYRIERQATSADGFPLRGHSASRWPWPAAARWQVVVLALVSAAALGAWLALGEPTRVTMTQPLPLSVRVQSPSLPDGDETAARAADALARALQNGLAASTPRGRIIVQLATGERRPGRANGETRNDARYRIETSVSHDAERFDVLVQLVDRASGAQLWSTRQSLGEHALSAESSPDLAAIIAQARAALFASETRRVAELPGATLTAPELLLRAWAVYDKDHSLQGVRAAMRYVEDAVRVDPNLAAAWNARAMLVNLERDVDPAHDRERMVRELDSFSERAVTLDPTDASAWSTRSMALTYLSRWDAALEAASRATKLDPLDSDDQLQEARIRVLMGRPSEAVTLAERVLKRNPASVNSVMRTTCKAHVLAGEGVAAVPACEKAAVLYNDAATLLDLIAAYAESGDLAKAGDAKAQLLRIAPGFSIEQLRRKRDSDHPDYLALAERNLYPALRRAGIAER